MNIIDKINKTRYSLKEILEDDWNTSTIKDLSNDEIKKIYEIKESKNSPLGTATGCNFSLSHKLLPSHKLHIIYYNFPEIGRVGTKVTKSCSDKILNLYNSDLFNFDDSVFIIINEKLTDSIEQSIERLNIHLQSELKEKNLRDEILKEIRKNKLNLEFKHFSNVHIFNINSLTNNLLKHRLVPKHRAIRDNNEIKEILDKTNCSLNQLPIIHKNDAMSKLVRLAPGDVCEILRTSKQCGEYNYYRLCK